MAIVYNDLNTPQKKKKKKVGVQVPGPIEETRVTATRPRVTSDLAANNAAANQQASTVGRPGGAKRYNELNREIAYSNQGYDPELGTVNPRSSEEIIQMVRDRRAARLQEEEYQRSLGTGGNIQARVGQFEKPPNYYSDTTPEEKAAREKVQAASRLTPEQALERLGEKPIVETGKGSLRESLNRPVGEAISAVGDVFYNTFYADDVNARNRQAIEEYRKEKANGGVQAPVVTAPTQTPVTPPTVERPQDSISVSQNQDVLRQSGFAPYAGSTYNNADAYNTGYKPPENMTITATGDQRVNPNATVNGQRYVPSPRAIRATNDRFVNSAPNDPSIRRIGVVGNGQSAPFANGFRIGQTPRGVGANSGGAFSDKSLIREINRRFDKAARINARGTGAKAARNAVDIENQRIGAIQKLRDQNIDMRGQDVQKYGIDTRSQDYNRAIDVDLMTKLASSQAAMSKEQREAADQYYDEVTSFPVYNEDGEVIKYEKNPVLKQKFIGFQGDVANSGLDPRQRYAITSGGLRTMSILNKLTGITKVPYDQLEGLLGIGGKPLTPTSKRRLSAIFGPGNYGLKDFLLGNSNVEVNGATISVPDWLDGQPIRPEELELFLDWEDQRNR